MKELDRDARLARLTEELTRDFTRWDHLYAKGGYDPFWSDGANLNLVRNHIISDKRQIQEIIESREEDLSLFETSYPDIYYRQTPEKVHEKYMANPEEIIARAHEQLALYEADPNFQYILKNQDKVFPGGKETLATKKAGLSIWTTSRLRRYRWDVEQVDLVAMRGDFYTPYEKKAPEWAEDAKRIKDFLESEHDHNDDVIVRDVTYDEEDALEEGIDDTELEDPAPKISEKPTLQQLISGAKDQIQAQEKNTRQQEEQLSLF